MNEQILKFLQPALRYWLAMNAAGVQSVTHTAQAFFAGAGMHAVVDSVPALTPHQLGGIFLLSFGKGVIDFLNANPIKINLTVPQIPAPQT